MPNNSKYKINNFSPDFRDALLLRNLLTDTVTNNSLNSWLNSINKPVDIGNGAGVKASPDIEVEGPKHRDGDVKYNKINKSQYFTNSNILYYSKDIKFDPNSKYYSIPLSDPFVEGKDWRESENTVLNRFKLGSNQYSSSNLVKYTNTDIVTKLSKYHAEGPSSVDNDAILRKDLNIIQNKYKGSNNDYEKISIGLLPYYVNSDLVALSPSPGVYAPTLEAYTSDIPNALVASSTGVFKGGNIRQFTTARNMYLDVAKQTRTDLGGEIIPTNQSTSYLDKVNGFRVGGASTQIVNVIGGVLTGGGVGFNPNSGAPVADFDIRSSLAGRVLGGTGLIEDTRLGQISAKYLAVAIGNNIAFNLQEETIGRINTNPLSLAMGGDLIVPNNKITVGSGNLGTAADIIERITGGKIPVSPLPPEADIFSYNKKGYISIGNIQRANKLLENTGKGTAQALFGNINSNTNPNLIGNRGGYAPKYISGDETTNPSEIYAFSDGDGGVTDLIGLSDENAPIAQSSHNLSGIISNSGFNESPENIENYRMDTLDNGVSKFIWSDTSFNKLPRNASSGDELLDSLQSFGNDFKVKKSLLYKTQELFNTNRMRTLVSGKGIRTDRDEITNTKSGFMSKGSAVLKNGDLGTDPNEIFARAWSPVDRYDQYKDLQKHSALSNEGRFDNVDVDGSVLGEHGIVQIGPYSDKKNIKKFMFSIENLAWANDLNKLLPCEKGPGDPITGRSGRIMWFPPYEISFNESTSASWDRTNFIGRGEPIYTYNNTERTGTLSWKIVVDHPNYLNYMKDRSDDEIAAFFAGALSIDEIRNRILSEDEKSALEVAENNKQVEGVLSNKDIGAYFGVFFPNDNNDVDYALTSGYEDGINRGNGKEIDYAEDDINVVLYSGEKTTVSGGGVGKAENYIDMTNFGFNRIGGTIGGKSYPGPLLVRNPDTDVYEDSQFIKDLGEYIEKDCKYCKFEVTGYANEQGGGDTPANRALALARGENVKEWLKGKLGIGNDRFKKVKSDVLLNADCPTGASVDSSGCKQARQVRVDLVYDSSLEIADTGRFTVYDQNEPEPRTIVPISRFYSECDYFDSVAKETDSFIYKDLKTKIKNFHPAFHAITPEGFNSRLTFLQQCMRQGPTDSSSADNLAFGRPPVCILRIGDFYHTKIIIESLTIDYEPLVWDLNPEGVGVQPMIANVNISFAFIGGSSLKGPINRLQNAISFNYFANTELYDPRAERIEILHQSTKNLNLIGVVVDGKFPLPPNTEVPIQDKPGIPGKNDKVISQTGEANQQANKEEVATEETNISNELKITGFEYVEVRRYGDTLGGGQYIRIKLKSEGFIKKEGSVTTTLVSKEEAQNFFSKGVNITLTNLAGQILETEVVKTYGDPFEDFKDKKAGFQLIEGIVGYHLGQNIYEAFGDKYYTINGEIFTGVLTVSYNGEKIANLPIKTDTNGVFQYYG